MHKNLLALSVFLFVQISANAQKWEYGYGLHYQSPQGSMAHNINGATGVSFQAGYHLPVLKNKLSVNADFGSGRYGKQRVEQTFQSDAVQTPTNFMVNYINFANYTHLNLRYEMVSKGIVIPYVQMIGGRQTLGTRVRINEYDEGFGGDGCEPLENDVTFRKRTMVWGYGGGVLVNLTSNKQRRCSENDILINFSVSQIRGGSMDYVNVKQLEQVQSTPEPDETGKAFTIPFININTNNIHNHTVARVYNSPLQQLQFRLGVIFRIEE